MGRGSSGGAWHLMLALPLAMLTACAANGGGATATANAGAALPDAPEAGAANAVMLVGASADQLDALFGVPEPVMRAGPAEWWRYVDGTCWVEVFLTRDSRTGTMVASHVELRPRPGLSGEATPSSCTLPASLPPEPGNDIETL